MAAESDLAVFYVVVVPDHVLEVDDDALNIVVLDEVAARRERAESVTGSHGLARNYLGAHPFRHKRGRYLAN